MGSHELEKSDFGNETRIKPLEELQLISKGLER